MSDVLPSASTSFGARVRQRLTDEQVIWLTTVSRDGTPQPIPVWFVWEGDDTVLVYNRRDARRLSRLQERSPVALHLNSTPQGSDVVVLTGTAEVLESPALLDNAAYLDKYADGVVRVSGSAEAFAADYSIPVRIHITHVRGF
jgi:PPOX class probable F420-dependent enzyme